MPAKLDRCIADVQADINAGRLPKGSSAYAICVSHLRKAGTIKKGGKGQPTWVLAKKGKKKK